ncbi:hypothetical protein GCM10010389_17980 [Streptomyces echinoruber]|uniref:Uncharacterized protein n=1 Tax=Streptomyces echinoruber TaxID=68898 RepID=A0A918V8V0_9ACTN|nr:hypothetical protein GCM10010389_17980 [Streptomyces echinoruber]
MTGLTLAGMSALTPHDTAVVDATAAGEPQETVLSRPYRALSIGIVSVCLLIAFEATAVGTPIAGLRHHHGEHVHHHCYLAE